MRSSFFYKYPCLLLHCTAFLMLCMTLNQVLLVVRNCTSCSALYERKSVTQVPTGSTSYSVANHSSVHHHLQNISRSSFFLSSSSQNSSFLTHLFFRSGHFLSAACLWTQNQESCIFCFGHMRCSLDSMKYTYILPCFDSTLLPNTPTLPRVTRAPC